jgi:hypothetical protein
MMDKYRASIYAPTELSTQQRDDMAALYLSYYDASSQELFLSDLAKKNEVLLVSQQGRLVGFTTLETFPWQRGDENLKIVYSGDTIVDQTHWGQQALAFAWIRRVGQIKREQPELPLYWLLIVKGHRTFKYLSTFGKTFYPHWKDYNEGLQELADELAREKFGHHYNPMSGVVEFTRSRGQLKPTIAEPSATELRKECVRFFLAKNPLFRIGHELVCMCALEESNMKPLTQRLFRQAASAKQGGAG